MNDPLAFNIIKFIIFIIPGFISIKIWGLIVANDSKKIADNIFEVISYSCFNYAALSWLIIIIIKNFEWLNQYMLLLILLILIILLICPILWPILLYKMRTTKFFKEHFIHPIPKPWDYFFFKKEGCFILIHLKNGKKIGGFFSSNSYASSYPEKEDLFIEQVWSINKKGEFSNKIEGTKGLWVSSSCFEYLEFFEIEYEDELK